MEREKRIRKCDFPLSANRYPTEKLKSLEIYFGLIFWKNHLRKFISAHLVGDDGPRARRYEWAEPFLPFNGMGSLL